MEKPATTTPKNEKHSFNWGALILWPVVIVLFYVLSAGPVAMMQEKGFISPGNEFFNKFYEPFIWAYEDTPLHKPLGLYLHLWVPDIFDKNGSGPPPRRISQPIPAKIPN
jgi:hypothetical protein